ncbi:iron-containing alcohol dehydrogenase [Mycolicibacterium fluoranthenivorans]|uniref:Iron-containing alcohol dehydrogenase n=1 Tax=Mycolicibacterium fluoranthenivorans TaxID=258505 RepID=A0A7G8PIH2_9MYCO|nr:iron-containing alcohol dehydrogenase [Mycolicibacterium fluoranthenivorans]QNJ94138.1 iron-containing alcohol dehydrogenase [Mycolicibacterium fluoranthenivorans]
MTATITSPLHTANQLGLGLLRQPAMVLFGPGQRRQIARVVGEIAQRVLIVTDARMATSAEFGSIVETLVRQGVSVSVYDGTEPDLPRRNVVDIAERFGGDSIQAIVGIGGGSCMDLAKVASVVLTHGGDVRDYYGQFLVPGPGIPVITVPTTGGTGAEVTCISVVFDEDQGMKVGVASPHLEAYAAIIDPELTLTCPPGLTAASGADALSHLIESFTGRAKNPDADQLATTLYAGKNVLADVYARTGLALLNTSLPAVAANPVDLAARSDTLFAAYCAGMAINTAGTAGAHAIQSPIGNLTHTPHGFGISALLPYVMRYNLPARIPEFAEIGRILGVAQQSDSEERQAQSAIERIEAILETLGAPLDLRTLGLTPQDFDFVAKQAMLATRLTANNPRELTTGSVVAILERGYDGDRSWWQL